MKEKLATPTCEITGLPLPVRIPEPHHEARFGFWDYHHHFHPRRHELLQGINGKAVRYSRGQYLPRTVHDRYHRLFDGPPLPTTDEERYRLSVLACAGVVPRQAIDVMNGGEVILLSEQEHETLAHPDSIYIEKAKKYGRREFFIRRDIGRFFVAYALQQSIHDVVSEKVIEEFLDLSSDTARKKELGNLILKEALGVSIDAIEPHHDKAKDYGLLPSSARYTRVRKVVRTFLPPYDFPGYHDQIAKTLALVNS